MFFIRCFSLIAFFLFASLELASAQTIINKSGVVVSVGGWDLKNRYHADDTYRAFLAARGGKPLSKYDYYYQLVISPEVDRNLRLAADCDQAPSLKSFLINLFGYATSSFVIVRMSATHRWQSGLSSPMLPKDTALLMIGHGADKNTLAASNACFFDPSTRVGSQLLRYEGASNDQDFDDFQLNFSMDGGTSTSSNFIATLRGIFTDLKPSVAWAGPISEGIGTIEAAGKRMEATIKAAGGQRNYFVANHFLKINDGNKGRLHLAVPNVINPNSFYLTIFARKVASLALSDGAPEVSPNWILQSTSLGNRNCHSKQLADGTCGHSAVTVLKRLMPNRKPEETPHLFDLTSDENIKRVYNLCGHVRNVTTGEMGLSTIDALLVRWAITKESKLQAALKNPEQLKLISAKTMRSEAEVVENCWNDTDEATLRSVLSALGKEAK